MTAATESPDESAAAAAVDKDVLDVLVDEIGAGDPAILVDLIASYLDEASGQVREIEQAGRAGDAATVAAVAHSLKSSSAVLGATGLADLLKRAELLARAESPEYPALVEPILREYARAADALRALRPAE